jgi:SAM-dependent methyltransferase
MEEGLSSMERDDPAYAGQREYTPLFLKIYDPLILGFFTPMVWRCPTTRLVEGYRRHLGHRHLDVGPGTGYFLERAGMPDGSPVTLVDPNVHVLDHASRRLQRLHITTIEADVCKALPVDGPFDSAALNGVLHCLPGPLPRKAAAVANVAAVLAPTGVFFGASILGRSGRHTWLSRSILEANNRRGTFDNLGDTRDGLGEILEASFERVELETVGSMAIFAARNPRPKPSTGMTPRNSTSDEVSAWPHSVGVGEFARRGANGRDDPNVAGAAAEVARQPGADLVVSRLGVRGQKGGRADQHPRGAEAALDPAMVEEGLLERMELRA